MKFAILKKRDYLNEEFIDNSLYIDKENHFSKILFIKVIVALIYAFYLGYNLFFSGDNYIKYGVKFLMLLILIYLFIDLPYNIFKALFLPGAFEKNNIILEINPFNLAIDITTKKEISKISLIFSILISILIFSLIPNILLIIYGFNIYTYAVASATTIYIVRDLYYFILLLNNINNKLVSTPYMFKFSN